MEDIETVAVVFVKLETRRTYQYISIYEEDNNHVMIDTSMYDDAYVVPNTIEDIETFLKSYKNGDVSDNAIEVQKYRKYFKDASPNQIAEGVVFRLNDITNSFKVVSNKYLLKGGE